MRNRRYFFVFHVLIFCLVLGTGLFALSHTSSAAVVTVSILAEEFDQEIITINQGDTVTWTNNSNVSHQIASDPHPTHGGLPGLGSGVLTNGQSYSFTFTQAGDFGYHDHLNYEIGGLVIVQATGGTPTPTPSPSPSPSPSPTPTPIPSPSPTPSPTPSPSPTPTPSPSPSPYLDGTLILDNGAIFVIEYGKKRPFVSMEVFTGLGYKIENVLKVSTAGIVMGDGIFNATGRHVRGAIVVHQGTVFFMGATQRYAFPSAEVFLSWGLKFKDVVNANATDIAVMQGPLMYKKP